MARIKKIWEFILQWPYAPVMALACIALFFTLLNKYLPSIDGPAHIYNSFLLKEYLLGNDAVRAHYALNEFYFPNLFSNYYLMSLMMVFGTMTALKIFYFSMLFLILYSAYYFFKAFKMQFAFILSVSFVLFFNAFLLNLGFYNFCFSVSFLLMGIAFFHKSMIEHEPKISTNLTFFLILFLLYYSNGLSFSIYIVFVACISCINFIKLWRSKGETKAFLMRIALIVCATLPFLIMFYLFNKRLGHQSGFQPVDIGAYWKNLIDFTSFIAYDRSAEQTLASLFFFAVVLAFVYSLIKRIVQFGFAISDILLMAALTSLALYFIVPDNYSVGMMSTRLQFFFYFFLIVWIFLQPIRYVKYALALFLFSGSVYKYFAHHSKTVYLMGHYANMVVKSADYIEPNSNVIAFNYSDNWLLPHFPNYVGIKKPIIVMNNYEASVGWFALRWRTENMPAYLVQGGQSWDKFVWSSGTSSTKKETDYILIYYGNHLLDKESELTQLLNNYTRVDKGEFEIVSIFKRK